MAFKSGILGSAKPTPGGTVNIYRPPAAADGGGAVNTTATVVISACNQGTTPDKIRIAIGASPPNLQDFITYDRPVTNEYERTAKVPGPGETITVYSLNGNVSFRVDGFEQASGF